ncbi:hypothetical protein Trydic_g12354 [Trypoxylus dichotomus]
MSIIARALFIRNDTVSLLQVNTTELVALLRNTGELKQKDCVIAAMCLTLISDKEIEAEIHAAIRILDCMVKTVSDNQLFFRKFSEAYQRLEKIFDNINRTIAVVTSNLVVITWRPFQEDFNGIAWYNGSSVSDSDYIEKLPRNWTPKSIDRNNFKMAVYVPYDLLVNLSPQSKLDEVRYLFIILIVAKENYFLTERFNTPLYDTVSIRIPGFCKKNNLPITKVLYEDELYAHDHGRKYIDESSAFHKTCILSKTTHFARISNSASFFESIKTEYCLRYPIGKTHYPQTAVGYGASPEHFCMNGKAEIPHLYCNPTTYSWQNRKSMDLECKDNYTTSINTHKIYEFATQCWNLKSFGDALTEMNSSNLKAIEMKMFYDILTCVEEFLFRDYFTALEYIEKNSDSLFDGINMALEFLKKLPTELMETTRLHKFLTTFVSFMNPYQMMLKAANNYIYQHLVVSSSSIVGIVVYRRESDSLEDYEVKHLTRDNITEGYLSDQSVEVVIYITNVTKPALQFVYENAFSILITRSTVYPENDTKTVKSKSVIISSCMPFEFRVFLRVTWNEESWRLNRYTNEGRWFNILLEQEVGIAYIAETHSHNFCIAAQEQPDIEEIDPMLLLIADDPEFCLLDYKNTDYMEVCLNIYREMSTIADSLFIGTNTTRLQVNTTKLISLLPNTEHLNQKDCIIAALCLTLMPNEDIEAEIDAAVYILGNIMKTSTDEDPKLSIIYSNAYQKFKEIVGNINRTLLVVTANLVVVTWYPFKDNFNGIAWYKGYNASGRDYIEKLPRNWTPESMDRNNLKMAVHIPQNFLVSLAPQSKLDEVRYLFITLIIARENYFLVERFSTSVYDTVSIKIPGFCKKNELPIVKVLYEDQLHDYDHGSKYIDESDGHLETCILSRERHFARISGRANFFESITTDYCLRYLIGETYFPQTPKGYGAYPENFCLNGKAEIPYLYCNPTTYSWKNQKSMDLECNNNYTTSINTHKIYILATKCWNLKSFDDVVDAMNSTNLEAIDKRMFYDILSCIDEFIFRDKHGTDYVNKNSDGLFKGINIALELLKEVPTELMKATRIHRFLILFVPLLTPERMMIKADDNYIYQGLQPFTTGVLGIAIYKRGSGSFKYYEVKYLTNDNTVTSLASDQSVEVIIYITNVKSMDKFYRKYECVSSILITRSTVYPENDTTTIKSRSLVVSPCISSDFDFKVFLRVIEDEESWRLNHYTGEGYWFSMTVNWPDVAITHIAVSHSHNYCESIGTVEIWKYRSDAESSSHMSTGKTTIKKIDLLSMVSMSVNSAESRTGTEEIYNEYSTLLRFFRMLGSTLSIVGVIILLTTALVLKNWRKTRFYTIQLIIILSVQIILFIVEGQIDEVPQAGVFIFYYSILSQFCWMSLIGYVQYMRYIKVFESRKVGIVKSLIIGWLLPALIIAISILFYLECFQCNLCYKNKEIFMYFVLIPVGLVVIANLIIYVLAMMNIWSTEDGESLASDRKLKIRASILLPFLLGITWIFLFALVSPWSWLFVVGLLLMHLILPFQGLVLCTFVVLLDESTRQQWRARVGGMLKKRK